MDMAVYEMIGGTYTLTRCGELRSPHRSWWAEALPLADGTFDTAMAILTQQRTWRRPWRLRDDLESGEWTVKYGHLLDLESVDLGYRLVIAEG